MELPLVSVESCYVDSHDKLHQSMVENKTCQYNSYYAHPYTYQKLLLVL